MAYEWFNDAVYNPLNSFTPSVSTNTYGAFQELPNQNSNSTYSGTPFGQAGGNVAFSDSAARKLLEMAIADDVRTDQVEKDMAADTEMVDEATQNLANLGYSTPEVGPTISIGEALSNAMMEMMKVYNIQNFASTWGRIRKDYPGITSDEAMNLLRYDSRYNKDYTTRFAGNQTRIKNGFGALDEKTYLEMEKGYSTVFKNYELPNFDNSGQYEILIGNNIDVVQTSKRVSMAYDRVLKSDPGTLNAWAYFYPQLSTGDIVSIMLDPKNQLGVMERKVQSAEIGGAALNQGLNASLAAQNIQSQRYSNLTTGTIGADAIRDTGETKAMAREDYKKIAGELPGAEKLSAIYAGQLDQYGQVEAEKSNILGLASEKRKLDKLVAREESSFKGSSGTSKGAFSTSYLNRQGKSGAF